MMGPGYVMALMVVAAPARPSQPRPPRVPTFREAYRRERAELLAERQVLRKQLAELTKKNGVTRTKLEGEIKALLHAAASRREAAVHLEGRLTAARERLTNVTDQSGLVEANLDVAVHSLRKLGIAVPDSPALQKRLEQTLESGIAAVRRFGTVHVRSGRFFGPDGVEVQGRIVHVGRIAALGTAARTGGVLVRVQNGGLKVADTSERGVARRLADGARLDSTPIHLLSPSGKSTRMHKKPGFMEQLRAGGIIAWVIVGLALFSLLIILERVLVLLLASNRARRLFERLRKQILDGRSEAAEAMLQRHGALARVLRVILQHRDESRERLDELAAESVLRETPRLERLLPLLGVAAAVAPLLGLLGTVTGMISTFRVITEHGTGDPRLLSGGISEALITTEFGLAVAIPVLLIHTMLVRWSDRITDQMQIFAMALINLLKRSPAEGAASMGGRDAVGEEQVEGAAETNGQPYDEEDKGEGSRSKEVSRAPAG